MDYRLVFVVAIFCFFEVGCVDVKKVEEIITERVENATEAGATEFSTRKGRANLIYGELVSCAVRYDTACLVGVAEDYLEIERQELLAQADAQVFRASGRADSDNSPSHLAKTIEKLLSELSGFFRNGLFSAREGEEDDEIAEADENSVEDEDENKEKDSRDVGESRLLLDKKKKKKKGGLKKLFRLVRVGVLAGVVIIKIVLLIKIFEAALKFKLLLVGVTSLLLQIVKFWMDFKEKKNAQHHDEGIPYKNPYEGGLSGAEWAGPGAPGGEYHARSDPDSQSYAQNLAYSKYSRK